MKLAKPQNALVHAEHQREPGKSWPLMSTEALRLWLGGGRNNSVLVLAEPISGLLTVIIPTQFEPTLLVIWMIFIHAN